MELHRFRGEQLTAIGRVGFLCAVTLVPSGKNFSPCRNSWKLPGSMEKSQGRRSMQAPATRVPAFTVSCDRKQTFR
jgi:hypothetical protein